jgi:hypothetical protein
MRRAVLILVLAWSAAAAASGPPGGAQQAARPSVTFVPGHGLRGTGCSSCHSTDDWRRVSFDHERTGFSLRGRHAFTACSSCHASLDFSTAVPTSCASCHRDVHMGEFGMRCASCHDEESWRSRFDADAHRRTNFPLTGRHATIPCQECHLDQRDRKFNRATVDCYTCHQADYARAATISIDHIAAGFSTTCRNCHVPWTFQSGRFPAHDACFQLAPGPHAGITCLGCHTSLTGKLPTGACATNTASCTRCHVCPTMQQRHHLVTGFQCQDRKCYDCHQFTVTSPQSRQRRSR